LALSPFCARAEAPLFPLDVVRAFCQADGRGERLQPRTWNAIAPLVNWQLEPAWDVLAVISGYQIEAPRYSDDHVEIDVQYTVTQILSGIGVDDTAYIDSVTFNLVSDGTGGWRIAAPPPLPHLFANNVDVLSLRAALAPDSPDYLSASGFVWRMLTDAGWAVPYRLVSQLRDPAVFAAVSEPKPGDLALFVADNVPYHVGFVSNDGTIASATANAGLMRTSPEAFAGTVLYLRLKQPRTSGPGFAAVSPDDATPRALVPTPRPRPAPTARGKHAPIRKPTRKPTAKKAKPRTAHSVKGKKTPTRRPTPKSSATARATPRPPAR
jgi:hypothetical protein